MPGDTALGCRQDRACSVSACAVTDLHKCLHVLFGKRFAGVLFPETGTHGRHLGQRWRGWNGRAGRRCRRWRLWRHQRSLRQFGCHIRHHEGLVIATAEAVLGRIGSDPEGALRYRLALGRPKTPRRAESRRSWPGSSSRSDRLTRDKSSVSSAAGWPCSTPAQIIRRALRFDRRSGISLCWCASIGSFHSRRIHMTSVFLIRQYCDSHQKLPWLPPRPPPRPPRPPPRGGSRSGGRRRSRSGVCGRTMTSRSGTASAAESAS